MQVESIINKQTPTVDPGQRPLEQLNLSFEFEFQWTQTVEMAFVALCNPLLSVSAAQNRHPSSEQRS